MGKVHATNNKNELKMLEVVEIHSSKSNFAQLTNLIQTCEQSTRFTFLRLYLAWQRTKKKLREVLQFWFMLSRKHGLFTDMTQFQTKQPS